MKKILLVSITIGLSGCASIIDGTSQQITVNTNPPSAKCNFIREGFPIASIAETPGSVLIKKTKHDMTIKCSKDGYQDASYFNKSGAEGSTFGNIVLGGGIGWAIDSAAGADNKYDDMVNITLVPVEPAPYSYSSEVPQSKSKTKK